MPWLGRTLSREEIIHKYLHLVKYVAGRISVNLPSNVDINDLINDGVFGLMDAIEKYDDSRAVKFETYAITRINGAILDALRSLDWVPRAVRQRAREVDRAFERWRRSSGATQPMRSWRSACSSRCASSTSCASACADERGFARGAAAEPASGSSSSATRSRIPRAT